MKRRTIAPGIYEDAYGFCIIARVGTRPNQLRSPEIRFPKDTSLVELQARFFREKMRLTALLKQRGGPVQRGTLSADFVRYFKMVTLSPQRLKEREQQSQWWMAKFGTRVRTDLKAEELQVAMKALGHLSVSTQHKYRTCLSNVFTVLDGKNAPNPFRDVPRPKEPKAQPRDVPYEVIQVVLAKIRQRGRGKTASKTRARLLVRAYCPVTQAQLNEMTAADVHWASSELSTPGRNKGAGTVPKRKPVSPQGMAALRAYTDAGCWGTPAPSKSSIWRVFTRARDAAIAELRETQPDLDLGRGPTMSPKDLRHSFATVAMQQSGNLDVVADLLDHTSTETTLRYAQSAVAPHVKAVGSAIAAAFAAIPPYVPPVLGRERQSTRPAKAVR